MHMLCISRVEFEGIYKQAKQKELFAAIIEKGYSFEELKADMGKMQEVVDSVRAELIKNKEEIEIFVALFGHLGMYPKGSKVCFILKDAIDPRKTPISTLDDVKSSVKEGSITDFGIMSDDGLRQFQLKQYRNKLTTDDLFAFIEKKLNHYGKDLGNTNLLVLLQSEGGDVGDIDFEELNKRIIGTGIKSEMEVLVSYNEENKFDVINVVYPTSGTCRKERQTEFQWYDEGR